MVRQYFKYMVIPVRADTVSVKRLLKAGMTFTCGQCLTIFILYNGIWRLCPKCGRPLRYKRVGRNVGKKI
ncbi:MAG: hypothetical protein RMI45_08400 [Ignisphaera sp.]|nr:hypothetical protein [Ignisphaera sp.]